MHESLGYLSGKEKAQGIVSLLKQQVGSQVWRSHSTIQYPSVAKPMHSIRLGRDALCSLPRLHQRAQMCAWLPWHVSVLIINKDNDAFQLIARCLSRGNLENIWATLYPKLAWNTASRCICCRSFRLAQRVGSPLAALACPSLSLACPLTLSYILLVWVSLPSRLDFRISGVRINGVLL